jgi:hypothetical protein
MRCPQCQQEDWIQGEIVTPRGGVSFAPKESKMFVLSYPAAHAQASLMCGFITIFVDTEKLKGTLKS